MQNQEGQKVPNLAFKGRTVVVFALPGAFTPTCSSTHLPRKRAQEDERPKVAIRVVHARTRETYGPRRLQPELAQEDLVAGRDPIARLRRHRSITRAEAETAIRAHIEIFCHRQRRHSRLGYLAPAEFAKRYAESAKAA